MTKATNEFRRCIQEAKELHATQLQNMQRERDAALLAARVNADVDDPNSMANQMQGVDQPPSKKVSVNSDSLSAVYYTYIYFFCFSSVC